MRSVWAERDVVLIALSAFFADLGYQAVQTGFPLMLVFALKAPVWLYGVAAAVSYGGGSLFAYVGGRLGDRVGHRRVALVGNGLIPILSLSALFPAPYAIACLTLGWWARNARTPSRRALLAGSAGPARLNEAFGLLHALDVFGGALAALYVVLMLALRVPWPTIFLLTILPLAASTYTLARTRVGGDPLPRGGDPPALGSRRPGYAALLLAAALYGLSYYSVGFPVLTVAQASRAPGLGVLAFLVFQLVSALAGYTLAGRLGRTQSVRFLNLALFGYVVSALGSAALGLGASRRGTAVLFAGVAVLGVGLGVVETLEPSLVALLTEAGYAGRGFGSLTAARSIGLLMANLILGLLYTFGPLYSYGYAAAVALVGGAVLLAALPAVHREERLGRPEGVPR